MKYRTAVKFSITINLIIAFSLFANSKIANARPRLPTLSVTSENVSLGSPIVGYTVIDNNYGANTVFTISPSPASGLSFDTTYGLLTGSSNVLGTFDYTITQLYGNPPTVQETLMYFQLVVSGSGATVPNLAGLTQAQADAAITGAGFIVGTKTSVANSGGADAGNNGNVVSSTQSPAASTTASLGSAISFSYYTYTAPYPAEIVMSASATAIYRIATTLLTTSDSPGKVSFYANGKIIPGCKAMSETISGASYIATCSWKPSIHGSSTIPARISPTNGNTANTTSPFSINSKARTTTR
jgi:hypothetical protein